ncbi:MAG: hypothetical protein CM15mP74_21260 [Halieaceae bacterium]|nr:MAG: hypothetical protein CM15mP74_21260 [Halieaceae bacterium]
MPRAAITLPIAEESLWSNESRRRATLASMGIMPLISRADSAGAKPAERFLAPYLRIQGPPIRRAMRQWAGNAFLHCLRETDASSSEMASP